MSEDETEEAQDIESQTRAYRDEVAGWSETKLRKEGEAHAVPGTETLDKGTIREALVQLERDRLRDEERLAAKVYAPA